MNRKNFKTSQHIADVNVTIETWCFSDHRVITVAFATIANRPEDDVFMTLADQDLLNNDLRRRALVKADRRTKLYGLVDVHAEALDTVIIQMLANDRGP